MDHGYINSKVSLILPNLSGGGAERVMVILANEFRETLPQLDLIIINDDNMDYASELSDKVNLVNLKTGRAGKSILSIRKYLIEHQPDVLLTTLGHISCASAIALSISGNIPTKLFVREDLTPKKVSIKYPFLYAVSILQKWAYKRATGIIALSEDMASDISRYYKLDTPIHTIYNPITTTEILEKSVKALEPMPPWPENTKFVLGVGRLAKQKDFKTLITAVAQARKTHDIKLIILGEGAERQNLESYARALNISDSVFMPGFVENPFSFMHKSSVFVLSSEREGLPNVLIQALLCGTKCIATNCPTGPREILENGAYGKLVSIGDHENIAKGIVSCLTDDSIKTPTPEVIRSKYNSKSIANQYLSVLLN